MIQSIALANQLGLPVLNSTIFFFVYVNEIYLGFNEINHELICLTRFDE